MGSVFRHVCLLLIIAMCGMEGAYTSTTSGKGPIPGRILGKPQIQKDSLPLKYCQWDLVDKSVTCEDKHLRTVPSEYPQSAIELYLQNNEISVLFNTSFEPYPNLVILDLKSNQLKTIQSAAFQPLKHLESLDLSVNVNLVIPNSVPFQPLEALVSLHMKSCNLKELPSDFMDCFPDLKYLHLGGNRLSTLNLSQCRTGVNLTKVILFENDFKYLTPDTLIFVCPTESFILELNPIIYVSRDAVSALPVKVLSLGYPFPPSMLFNLTSGVAMSTISALVLIEMELGGGIPFGAFTPLRNHTLDTIAIDRSGELSLHRNIFFGVGCIGLELSRNSIKNIEPEYFRGMLGLKLLGLWYNRISNFNPHNTTWENDIEHLDMTGNNIIMLYGYQFRGLSNLRSLNLSYNRELVGLVLRPYNWFESLEIINITNTRIIRLSLPFSVSKFYSADLISQIRNRPFIPGQTFNNSLKLKQMDLSHSHLNKENLWDFYVSVSLFNGLVKLQELYLSNNPLGKLPDRVFVDNSLLAKLIMDNCKISSLTGTVFQGLVSLVYLDLNGNSLLLLSANALKYLPNLDTLSLNDNIIMSVQEGAMENVPLLKNLRMSNNLLVAFNRSTWRTLMNNNLNYIDVSGNPLACQCNYDWLHDHTNSSGMFLHQNITFCSVDSLSELRGKPFLEFDPSKYCVPNIVLISTLPFAALALLIGLLLAFHHRWLIRYKLFLVRLAIIGYREMQDAREHGEFVFDLNIMFTENDEEWAREHLRPTLEERLPDYNRYSFGDEDLTLGMHYLEAVHYAVDNSFKTILLLSRRAVRDNWFLIKFRSAMDRVHDEMTENTVVIFLEDIPEDEIPYLVRLYLSDRRAYMRWPKDVRGREYFWNELAKLVPFNLMYNPLIPPE